MEPVASAKDLMKLLVIPASDGLYDAAAEPPKTDEGWAAVRRHALILAESANLLMVGRRGPDQGEWLTRARAQLDAARGVIVAVDAKNPDALSTAANLVDVACTACHAKYMDKTK